MAEKRKAGRPVGSKHKANLSQAIRRLEAHQKEAAEVIIAIMMNDKAKLDLGDEDQIKISERKDAAKYVLTEPRKLKETLEGKKSPTQEEVEDTEVEFRPLIQVVSSQK